MYPCYEWIVKCVHWVKRCILPIYHCSLSSDRFDCVCSKLKMSSESYCCYLVCCSFDSLLEQPVSWSLLEQPVSCSLLEQPVSCSLLKQPVSWSLLEQSVSWSLWSLLSKSTEIASQASPVSRLWRVPYHVMMLYPVHCTQTCVSIKTVRLISLVCVGLEGAISSAACILACISQSWKVSWHMEETIS